MSLFQSDDVTTTTDVTAKAKPGDVIIQVENGGKDFDHQNESGATEPILGIIE